MSKWIISGNGNEPPHLFVGSKLRIKYLPGKPKYVIPAK